MSLHPSSIIPDYRKNVRRFIPPDVHTYLLECHLVEAPHRHVLTDCPAPDVGTDFVSVANILVKQEDLRGDLVYAVSVMRTSTSIVDTVILPGARFLQARIGAELRNTGMSVSAK